MSVREPNEMTRLVVSYTALRLAVFAVVFLLLLFTPLAKILVVGIALVVSAIVSYPLGRHQRDRMTQLILERRERKSASSRSGW